MLLKPEQRIKTVVIKSETPSFLQMLGFGSADPFYAVYAYKLASG